MKTIRPLPLASTAKPSGITVSENDVYEQVAQYLNLKYPHLLYHFDLSGLWTNSHKARNLYGRLNRRAFPDLIIYKPVGDYAGLAIEIKKEGVVLYKKDGSLRKNAHHEEQETVLAELQAAGYYASFAVGYYEVIRIIEEYLGQTANLSGTRSRMVAPFHV